MPTAIIPGIYDASIADENLKVDTETAYRYCKAAGRYLGLLMSPSAAANLVAAMQVMKALTQGTVVTIFADNATKYLQDPFWTDHDYDIPNPFN